MFRRIGISTVVPLKRLRDTCSEGLRVLGTQSRVHAWGSSVVWSPKSTGAIYIPRVRVVRFRV